MKVQFLHDWSEYKKGQTIECKADFGSQLVCTGTAVVIEHDRPTAREMKKSRQAAEDHPEK